MASQYLCRLTVRKLPTVQSVVKGNQSQYTQVDNQKLFQGDPFYLGRSSPHSVTIMPGSLWTGVCHCVNICWWHFTAPIAEVWKIRISYVAECHLSNQADTVYLDYRYCLYGMCIYTVHVACEYICTAIHNPHHIRGYKRSHTVQAQIRKTSLS